MPKQIARWIALGAIVGVIAGLSSAGFLITLDIVTDIRLHHPWLLWLLPAAGLGIGLAYHHYGGAAAQGNALILDEIHQPRGWLPRRMAPLVYVGTEVTHLFGGSAGREGTALQMSGSLTDAMSRRLGLDDATRRILLITALAGGFGAVFGVPFAGLVFGLEVQPTSHLRRRAVLPCTVASFVGDRVVRATGFEHFVTPRFHDVPLSAEVIAKVAVAGIVFGLVARAFVVISHGLKAVAVRYVDWPPLRPVLGGVGVIALVLLVDSREYLGLSTSLAERSLAGGVGVVGTAFALKLLFTAVTLGSGFPGGEVTPLFVVGATLGVTVGRMLDLPIPLIAALGFVAVFGGAARVPVSCTMVAAEMFGIEIVPLAALACAASWVVAHPHGIYGERRPAQADERRGTMPP